jgi:hypothetical protein
MQHPSTYAGPRTTTQRARRAISPINAAQRAGYGLDAVPGTVTPPPAAQAASAKGPASTGAKAH